MSNSDKKPVPSLSLAELKAKINDIVNGAKTAEKLQRQAAKQALRGIVSDQRNKFAAQRRKLLREHQRREESLQKKLGAAMLGLIVEHGLDNACMTPGDFKTHSPDDYSILLSHLQAMKELEAERSALKKKEAPKEGKIVADNAKSDHPITAETTESGETH